MAEAGRFSPLEEKLIDAGSAVSGCGPAFVCLFAEALAKQYDATLPYLTEHRLSPWVHNKAIQKIRESRRATEEYRAAVLALKR